MISAAFVGFMVTFIQSTSAGDTSCLNITLPNFLGIGKCLGTSGNVCTSSQDAVELVGLLVDCSLQGISSLSIGSQLYLVEEFLTYLLNRNELGTVARILYGFCKRTFNSVLNCNGLQLNASDVCGDEIVLNLPSILGLGKCLNQTGETCDQGNPVLEPALVGFFRVLTCFIETTLSTNVSDILNGLLCNLLNFVKQLLGTLGQAIQNLILGIIEPILKINCG